MFGSSFSQFDCRRSHILFMLLVFACVLTIWVTWQEFIDTSNIGHKRHGSKTTEHKNTTLKTKKVSNTDPTKYREFLNQSKIPLWDSLKQRYIRSFHITRYNTIYACPILVIWFTQLTRHDTNSCSNTDPTKYRE
jgi:hypothetical protein